MLDMRTALFLQGPHGAFFYMLGQELSQRGFNIVRVNLCGGDLHDWPHGACNYRGCTLNWSEWIADIMDKHHITDLLVYGDWRPYHREAVHIAKLRGIQVWAFDEGYLRPEWITMARDGVNGSSTLPSTPEGIQNLAGHTDVQPYQSFYNPRSQRIWKGFVYAAWSVLGIPFFPFYRTHRPYSHLRELICGWIPRFLLSGKRSRQKKDSIRRMEQSPYFLFPLQLDTDSQVLRYSPFRGMKEAIAYVITSFVQYAPKHTRLVIRNHPLDNGLIRYDRFIKSFSIACGVEDRIVFIDGGNGTEMIRHSIAVVLLNSTMGLQALELGKPVFCIGKSIYAMYGLAENACEDTLEHFWNTRRIPNQEFLNTFKRVLFSNELVNGNFYYGEGQKSAVRHCAEKLMNSSVIGNTLKLNI